MYLEYIKSPDDLKKLSVAEMKKLAGEIRDEMVYRVSKNGGHLASNLGVVELSIALHYVFNTPEDRLILRLPIWRLRYRPECSQKIRRTSLCPSSSYTHS